MPVYRGAIATNPRRVHYLYQVAVTSSTLVLRMKFLQFVFGFLYERNWHTGELEFSRPRVALFSAMLFLLLFGFFIVSILQTPTIYVAEGVVQNNCCMRDVFVYLCVALVLLMGALAAVYYVWSKVQSLPEVSAPAVAAVNQCILTLIQTSCIMLL